VSVNVYVLISGYFCTVEENVIKRPLKIWKQVFFYSVVIGLIAMLTGIQKFDIYQIFNYIFPIVTEHYWFATSYILLCLFMPFLSRGFAAIDKRQAGYIIVVMLILFSVSKTVIPMHLPWDKYGYDVLWFVVLYLTGAYIRKYGLDFMSKKGVPIIVYILSVLIIFASFVLIRFIYLKTGKLEDFIDYGYSYNFLFCYTGAVGLFVAFGRLKSEVLEKFRKPIELLSGATFGCYLIHEHINIRYLWPTWFNAEGVALTTVPVFLVSMVGTVAVVYLVCSLIDIIIFNKGRNK
jgi:hypothetical protein